MNWIKAAADHTLVNAAFIEAIDVIELSEASETVTHGVFAQREPRDGEDRDVALFYGTFEQCNTWLENLGKNLPLMKVRA